MNASDSVKLLQESIYQAIHMYNYKNGAFKDKITKDTTSLEAVNILLASPLLSEAEKLKTNEIRRMLMDYERDGWAGLSQTQVLVKSAPIMGFCEMFETDMQQRGMYVPPILAQGYDPTSGRVTSTSSFDSLSGTGRTMPGGTLGVVPGAPLEFNAANAKAMADLGLGPQASGKQNTKNGQAGAGDKAKESESKASDKNC